MIKAMATATVVVIVEAIATAILMHVQYRSYLRSRLVLVLQSFNILVGSITLITITLIIVD
jgi:hypothetical protein